MHYAILISPLKALGGYQKPIHHPVTEMSSHPDRGPPRRPTSQTRKNGGNRGPAFTSCLTTPESLGLLDLPRGTRHAIVQGSK